MLELTTLASEAGLFSLFQEIPTLRVPAEPVEAGAEADVGEADVVGGRGGATDVVGGGGGGVEVVAGASAPTELPTDPELVAAEV